MEIMDDDKLRRDEHASVMRSRNLFLGVTLIVVGVLWMMNNLELLSDSLFDVVFSWPLPFPSLSVSEGITNTSLFL